jgi:hypothetical protein
MKPITKVVSEWTEKYFGNTEIEISEEGNHATYRFTSSDKGDFEYRCFVEVYEKRPGIIVFHYAPFKVPKQYRNAVAEVLVLANYALVGGAIGMNMQDGELRFKTGVDVMDGAISVAMINELVDRATSIMDQYLPAVAAVIYAGQSPEQAYAKADNPDEKPSPDKSAPESTTAEVRSWDSISGNEAIRAWSTDLQNTLADKGDLQEWEMTGRAAIIVNDDKHYCREILRRVAEDNGITFVSIATADVMDIPPPSGMKCTAPALVYLEPGRWMRSKSDSDENESVTENARQFQLRLADYLRNFNSSQPIIYVTSISKLGSVASRLMQVGLFERFISIPKEDIEQMGNRFLAQIGKDACSDALSNSLTKIGKLLTSDVDDAERSKLAALCLRRLYQQEKRPLEFIDLVHAITHGLLEEGQSAQDTEDRLIQTAVHEAGHAVVAVVDSDGKNIPEYTSILPSVFFRGVVVESYAFHCSRDDMNTYRDFRHNIRICLAGRAAEELMFGIEGITSGVSSDIEDATKNANRAFSYSGFAPQMEVSGRSGSNLAVLLGNASNCEVEYLNALVREFLEKEYEVVKSILEKNRSLLDVIAKRLMSNPILDQSELSAIYSEYQVG